MKPAGLTNHVTVIPMIGAAAASKLKKLAISTVGDLLHHYPSKHLDRSIISPISDISEGQSVTIVGQVTNFQNIYTKSGKSLQVATVTDQSGIIQITWFNQQFLKSTLKLGLTFAFSGNVTSFNSKLSLVSPEHEPTKDSIHAIKSAIHTAGLVPIYPLTAGISSKWLRHKIKLALEQTKISEHLPKTIISSQNLISHKRALKHIHFPPNHQALSLAHHRLAFDELFFLHLNGALKKRAVLQKHTKTIEINAAKLHSFTQELPFKLTKAQHKAVQEIITDLNTPTPMNRLLEGDVGSGKTAVAACAMYLAHLGGYRSAIMAPTEILAHQHHQQLSRLFSKTNIKLGLYTGSTKSPNANVVVGTHALLYQLKSIPNLNLIVIDEQHRFGVQQRAKLENLGTNPHRLTMSATPIPRTIALTLYGDLNVSIIDELPKGRKPVKTWIVPETKRQNAYEWIDKQIHTHHAQVFVVCPIIDPSESVKLTNTNSAMSEFQRITKKFKNRRVDMLHGRMKSDEKTKIINSFHSGRTHILVSTQVVEVGIDVPNATIMIIEAPERFGLAQLHQLRGRVGRANNQGYCLLFPSQTNKQISSRLKSLVIHNSGFKLAQIDLKTRGPGNVFGLQQHGFSNLKLANLTDTKLVSATKKLAHQLITKDPNLITSSQLKQKLQPFNKNLVADN